MNRTTLARDRALLTLMLVRQSISVAVIVGMLVLAFQLPDRRFAYIFSPIAAVFVAVTLGMALRWISQYRTRARAVQRAGERA